MADTLDLMAGFFAAVTDPPQEATMPPRRVPKPVVLLEWLDAPEPTARLCVSQGIATATLCILDGTDQGLELLRQRGQSAADLFDCRFVDETT